MVITFTLPTSLFLTGNNTIAVEIHSWIDWYEK
jgi:hypothetical protein